MIILGTKKYKNGSDADWGKSTFTRIKSNFEQI
jgi:hypothetical protein